MREVVIGAFDGPGRSPDPDDARNVWPAPGAGANGAALKAAAVLVPLIDRAEGMTVLLTRRTDTLPAHAGQIAFPGGGKDAGDRTPEDTALRETEEEIGLPRHHVELVGRLNAEDTGTGYRVMPVVGLINPPFPLDPHPAEVAGIFEVPIGFVLDPANHRYETRLHRGAEHRVAVLAYRDHVIWGLTARLLVSLSHLLRR